MLSLIDKYIARHVIAASLLVIIIMVMLRSLFSLLDELADVGRGSYQFADALLYVGLMFPQRLIEFFPMGVLLGSLLGLGSLASNNELTVLRAAGMSTWRIAASALKAAMILVVLMFVISEWVAPAASRTAQQLRLAAISGGNLAVSETGTWAKREREIIQIGSVQTNGRLKNVRIYTLNEQYRVGSLVQAETAIQEQDRWLLYGVTRYQFLPQRVATQEFSRLEWQRPLEQDKLETLTLEPDTMNLINLYHYIDYLKQNQLDTGLFRLSWWRKIWLPVAIAVMVFVASSFVFGPMRSVTMGARTLVGVLLGFAFHLANQSFGPISLVYGLPPFLGAALPVLLFALLGYSLMKRAR